MSGFYWISAVLVLLFTLVLTACTPSLSPLYRDYEVLESDTLERDVYERIYEALQEAGWTPAEASAENVVATESKTIRNWGLYKIVVSLEVVPVGDEHLRIFIHPYRQYITGGRSKIPYLASNLRTIVLPDLNKAFEHQGFELAGMPYRDQE